MLNSCVDTKLEKEEYPESGRASNNGDWRRECYDECTGTRVRWALPCITNLLASIIRLTLGVLLTKAIS